MVKEKPASVKGASKSSAWKNVNHCRYDCNPKKVAADKVGGKRLPIVVTPVEA